MTSANELHFADLRALFVNCTLKRSPELSHTQGLIGVSSAIMRSQGVSVESLRAVDHDIARGVYADMTEYGWERDEWPQIAERVMAADILVIGSPIWLGDKSSVCTMVIEHLYSSSGDLNDIGQYAYYGRVGGCLITGNEDGAKHCSMNIGTPASASASNLPERPTRAESTPSRQNDTRPFGPPGSCGYSGRSRGDGRPTENRFANSGVTTGQRPAGLAAILRRTRAITS